MYKIFLTVLAALFITTANATPKVTNEFKLSVLTLNFNRTLGKGLSGVFTKIYTEDGTAGTLIIQAQLNGKEGVKALAKELDQKSIACRVIGKFNEVEVPINYFVLQVVDTNFKYIYVMQYPLRDCFNAFYEGYVSTTDSMN